MLKLIPVTVCHTLRELSFAGTNFCSICGFGPKLQYQVPEKFKKGKTMVEIIHRTALVCFQVKNPQNFKLSQKISKLQTAKNSSLKVT